MIPFDKEVNLIQNKGIRLTTQHILCSMPAWFMKEEASSTGKYHPTYAQGEGGLYRHTCAAVKIYNDIASLQQYKEVIDNKDWGIAALILHDMCKYGYDDMPSKYTKFDHPLLVRKWLEYLQYESASENVPDEEYINNVCNLVESHMGQWNTNKYYPNIILPTPLTANQQLVHLADYLASRNYLEVNLNERSK